NGSNGNDTVTASKRDSTTTVSCSPNSVEINQGPTCTTPGDNSYTNSGTGIRPGGTVTFSKGASDAGSFSAGTCNLPATGTNSCSVTFTPSATGGSPVTFTTRRSSDLNGSNGNDTVTASKRDSTTTVSCSPNS